MFYVHFRNLRLIRMRLVGMREGPEGRRFSWVNITQPFVTASVLSHPVFQLHFFFLSVLCDVGKREDLNKAQKQELRKLAEEYNIPNENTQHLVPTGNIIVLHTENTCT